MREPDRADPGTVVIRDFNILWPCEIQVEDFVAVGSSRMSLSTITRLAARIEDVLKQSDVAGVVVTHGTATLEETAYYLSLVISSEKPVVVTGAMRRPSELSSDAQRNLWDSILVAAHPMVRGMGTIVVMNGEMHDPAIVRKLHTKMLDAFKSLGGGPLGFVNDDVYLVYRPRSRRILPANSLDASVQLIRTVVDQDDIMVRACTEAAVDAIVLEGMGGGFIPPRMMDAVREALNGKIYVLLTPRCGAGSFIRQEPFEATLSGKARQYLLYSKTSGHKERLKLMALLSYTKEPSEIAQWFSA